MNSHRFLFYVADATSKDLEISLTGEEHHHFTRVLRRKTGQVLYITNGMGLIAECEAIDIGGDETRTRVRQILTDLPTAEQFVLALAVIKKDKFAQAFEQCVELGITGCVPFLSANTQTQQNFDEQFLERLEKISVSSIKQSFRPHLPRVVKPVSFDTMVAMARGTRRVIVGEQGAPPASERKPLENTMVVIGPEAGLSRTELMALKEAGAQPAAVSSNRLRAETASVALVAAVTGRD